MILVLPHPREQMHELHKEGKIKGELRWIIIRAYKRWKIGPFVLAGDFGKLTL